jgi:hypothetical protein
MDDVAMKIATSQDDQGPSRFRDEFLLEQQVLHPMCGLPRVIRAFVYNRAQQWPSS